MNTTTFAGTGVAVVTPFRKDDSVDFKALEKHVNYLIENKIDYLVALGTTSESATLNDTERRAVVDLMLEVNNGRIPVVVGIGGNNTAQLVHTLQKYDFDRISGVLSVVPYYNKPNQRGMYEHFKAEAQASPVPVIMYNVPSRTSANMGAETTIKLAHEFTNLVAVKEASGNLEQVSRIIRDSPPHFSVVSGDDMLTLPIISLGGRGIISVSANAFPLHFSEMVRMALANNWSGAQKMHARFVDVIDVFFCEGNPAGVKAALRIMDIMQNHLRLPLTRVSKNTYQRIAKIVDDMKTTVPQSM